MTIREVTRDFVVHPFGHSGDARNGGGACAGAWLMALAGGTGGVSAGRVFVSQDRRMNTREVTRDFVVHPFGDSGDARNGGGACAGAWLMALDMCAIS
ncbi:hypothetical protein I6E29_02100 [Arcanobacterium haemolyticum]|nr:hypothetical protein [Arcanobacterium haemolyticum]